MSKREVGGLTRFGRGAALPLVLALGTPLAPGGAGAGAANDAPNAWPQFRGPHGAGLAAGAAPLPAQLDPERNLLWRSAVPPGHSSPCITGDRVFLTAATERLVSTLCLDRRTGAVLWEQPALTDMFESRHHVNSAASPTPATDGERVFVYIGSCGLICYDLDGHELWLRRLRIPENMYGSASSPIVADGRLVFLHDSARQSWIEAIDPATGETLWHRDRPEGASWSTPMHWRNGDVDEVVVYGAGWVAGYALADGAERWSLPGLTDEPCITPVAGDGLVYITSYNMRTNQEVVGLPPYTQLLADYDANGDGQLAFREIRANRSILSRNDADGEGDHPLAGFFRYLDADRDGQVTEVEWQKMIAFLDAFQFANGLIALRPSADGGGMEVAWTHDRGVPECPSPLHYDGRVYMVKNGGIATCVDAATGERRFFGRLDSGGPYYASPVAGDGKIYAASARGVVTVLAAGDELRVLARNDLGERIMATPALVDGVVYVRTEEAMYAFGEVERE